MSNLLYETPEKFSKVKKIFIDEYNEKNKGKNYDFQEIDILFEE